MTLIVCLLTLLQDPVEKKQDPAEELKALQADYAKATEEYWRPFKEAKSDEEREKAYPDPSAHPVRTFLAKFKDLADRAKGAETAARAHLKIIEIALETQKKKDAVAAVDALVAGYLDSPLMEALAGTLQDGRYLIGSRKCDETLDAIFEKTTHHAVKGAVLLAQAAAIAHSTGAKPEAVAKARERLALLKKEYTDTPYAAKADELLIALDLRVGNRAPDFEAVDQDGKKWKLSDYRGKVVVVDFWGFW